MKKFVFNLATVVSLVICVASVWLWVKSYSRVMELEWRYTPDHGEYFYTRELKASHGGMGVFTAECFGSDWAWEPASNGRWVFSENPRGGYPYLEKHDAFRLDRLDDWYVRGIGFEAGHDAAYARPGSVHPVEGQLVDRATVVVVPLPLIVAVTALLPALSLRRLWRYRANRRTAEGKCRACGYDLRATPDRCPECGAVALK